MLALAFFISVFSTLIWLIFSAAYVTDHLNGVSFISLGIIDISIYLALILLPILILWMVFGFINQYLASRSLNNNMFSLFKQMKKNQDYTDLIARIMLEAEQEIKDGFILNKFDLFIADMNELLADLLLRSNIASSEQIERLWTKVQNGGKWAFGKVLIEVNQNQPNFQMRVFEKSQQDNVIAGTILEWCARYLSLTALLEKHDKERVFITIIETGVFGKVFSILAPVSDEIRRSREFAPAGPAAPSFAQQPLAPSPFEPESGIAAAPVSVPKLRPGFAPSATEDNDRHFFDRIDTKSFAARLNPFRKKDARGYDDEPIVSAPAERDPLSLALERSFGAEAEPAEPRISAPIYDHDEITDIRTPIEPEIKAPTQNPEEPRFEIGSDETPFKEPLIERTETVAEPIEPVRFNNTTKTLNDLKKEWEEMRTAAQPAFAEKDSPAVTSGRDEEITERKKPAEPEEENYSYPFGGWTDESNYRK